MSGKNNVTKGILSGGKPVVKDFRRWRMKLPYQCAFKEVTFCEFGPGGSPKRSQAPPFVAEEIRRDRPRPRFSMFPV